MISHGQAQVLVFQLLITVPLGHMDIDDTAAFRPLDMEVHPEVRDAQLIDLDRMSQWSGPRPLVRSRFSVSPDLLRGPEEFPAPCVCFDSVDSMVELTSLAVGRKEFLVEEVGNRKLEGKKQVSTVIGQAFF